MALNVGLLAIEVLALGGVAIALHASSHRYGLAPMLVFVTGLVAVLHSSGANPIFIDAWGMRLVVTDSVIVPVILASVLMLYDVQGTAVARVTILGVVGISVLVLSLQVMLPIHLALPGGFDGLGLPADSPVFTRSWKMTIASILSFIVGLAVISVVHQALRNALPGAPRWLAPGLALIAALAIDDVVFRLGAFGPAAYLGAFPGGLPGKVVAAALLWPMIGMHLARARRDETDERPTLDLLFGSYRQVEQALQSMAARKQSLEVRLETEARQAERALEESEVRFSSTFRYAGVGLVHADLQGIILMANQAFLNLLDYSEDELVGRNVSDLTFPEDVAKGQAEMARVIAGDVDQFQIDKRYVRKDGGVFWCQTTATLVRSPAGRPLYFVVAIEDLTARLATEAQLRQAQKMEAVGQLTGGVAHDFNNLLTVVMGGLEIAMADLGHDPEGAGPLQEALRSAEKGAELTRQLLAFSRRQALRPVAMDVAELLAHMKSLLVRTLGETIDVEVSVDADAGRCVADRAQIESAILNLSINARDAMPKGGRLSITASLLVADEAVASRDSVAPGTYVELRITDTGTGMPPEALERAFDPFYTTKEVGKGSGLGLSMVYGFAKQSGGAVHLLSEAGEGLTVRLLLPSASAATEDGRESKPKLEVIGGGGETILLVEDDPGVRQVMTATLRKLGYEVIAVAEAAPALDLLGTRGDIDLLLTDVVLTGELSGPELARVVIDRHPSLPIVFTSGYSVDALPDFAESSRHIPLLTKPFHREELASLVAESLGHNAASSSST